MSNRILIPPTIDGRRVTAIELDLMRSADQPDGSTETMPADHFDGVPARDEDDDQLGVSPAFFAMYWRDQHEADLLLDFPIGTDPTIARSVAAQLAGKFRVSLIDHSLLQERSAAL